MMDYWHVERQDDPFEILARSGGIQVTDRLELAEYRSLDDDLSRPLLFAVAGMRHYGGAPRVKEGQSLQLVREPESGYDAHATYILVTEGVKLGYVPRHYAPIFARLMDAGARLEAKAMWRLALPADESRWFVQAWRA